MKLIETINHLNMICKALQSEIEAITGDKKLAEKVVLEIEEKIFENFFKTEDADLIDQMDEYMKKVWQQEYYTILEKYICPLCRKVEPEKVKGYFVDVFMKPMFGWGF